MVKHTSEIVIGGGAPYLDLSGVRQRYRDSSEESDSVSSLESTLAESSLGGSFASSVSSPGGSFYKANGLVRREDGEGVDQKKLTVAVLSKLRDLWELSNGSVCFEDGYESVKKAEEGQEVDVEIEEPLQEEVEGLAIQMGDDVEEGEVEGEAKEEKTEGTADVIKRVMGVSDSKRANIIKEIVDTEETYIRGLEELVEVHPSPPLLL